MTFFLFCSKHSLWVHVRTASVNSEKIIRLDSFSKQIFKYFGIFQLISAFQTTAILKFANSQHYPPAPFARFIGSLMWL